MHWSHTDVRCTWRCSSGSRCRRSSCSKPTCPPLNTTATGCCKASRSSSISTSLREAMVIVNSFINTSQLMHNWDSNDFKFYNSTSSSMILYLSNNTVKFVKVCIIYIAHTIQHIYNTKTDYTVLVHTVSTFQKIFAYKFIIYRYIYIYIYTSIYIYIYTYTEYT